MPEGPEIKLAADKIAAVIEGEKIIKVEVGLQRLIEGAKRLEGEHVKQVETRGKAMLIHFANDWSIYSHNQLYGVWKTAKLGKLPNTKRTLRLALHTTTQSALLYSASDIAFYPTDELGEHPFLQKIGPDVLSESIKWQDVFKRLQSSRFSGRSLSALYLDQHFIAGIGNYLRSEILFLAGVHPDDKPKQLSDKSLKTLAKQTLQVSKRAYETRGHTVPETKRKALAKSKGSYESVRYMVFNREELACRVCVTPVTKAHRNSRRIYWCEQCQARA